MSNIHLVLVTPEKTLFECDASWIQVPAYDGYMGFLYNHAPLVSPAGTGIITCRCSDGDHHFTISGGYFEIHLNQMVVLADSAEAADEIDITRAENARDRALERILGKTPGDWDTDRAKAALMRALNRLKASNKDYRV